MKKIPTLFERDWNGDKSRVTEQTNPLCQWVIDGEGVATQKYDGTACLIENGELWCRFDAKNGKHPPANFVGAQPDPDPETGHWPGWVPAGTDSQYKWQRAAFEDLREISEDGYRADQTLLTAVPDNPMARFDGTWEAIGPHFQGNPEGARKDILVRHGLHKYVAVPLTFAELKDWLAPQDMEGLVWHHPDGRMAKIKKKDFGLPRKVTVTA